MSGYNSLLQAVQRAMDASETYLNVIRSSNKSVTSPDGDRIPTFAERSKVQVEKVANEFAGLDGRSVTNVTFDDDNITLYYDDKTRDVFTGFKLKDGSSIAKYEYRDGKLIKFTNYQFDENGELKDGETGTVDTTFAAGDGTSIVDAMVMDNGSIRIYYSDGTTESIGDISDFASDPIEKVEIVDGYLYFTVAGKTIEAQSVDENGNPVRVALDGSRGEDGLSFYDESEKDSFKLIPPGYVADNGHTNNSDEYFLELLNEFSPNQEPPNNWYGPISKRVRVLESEDVVNVRFEDGDLTLMWPNASAPVILRGLDGVDGNDSNDTDKSLFDGEFINEVTFDDIAMQLSFHTNKTRDKWIIDVPKVQLPSGQGSIERVSSPSNFRMPAVIFVKIDDGANSITLPISLGRVRGWDGRNGTESILRIENDVLVKDVNDDRTITTTDLVDLAYPIPESISLDPLNENRVVIKFADDIPDVISEETADGKDGIVPRVDESSWDIGDSTNEYSLSFKMLDSVVPDDEYKDFIKLRPLKGYNVSFDDANDQLVFDFENTYRLDVTYGSDGLDFSDDIKMNSQGEIVIKLDGEENDIISNSIPSLEGIEYDYDASEFILTYSDGDKKLSWSRPDDGESFIEFKEQDVVYSQNANTLSITFDGDTTVYDNINTTDWPISITKNGDDYTIVRNSDSNVVLSGDSVDGDHMMYISDIGVTDRNNRYYYTTVDLNDGNTQTRELFQKMEVRWAERWYIDEVTNMLHVRFSNSPNNAYEEVNAFEGFHKNNIDYTYFIGDAFRIKDNGTVSIYTDKDVGGYTLQHEGKDFYIHGEKETIVNDANIIHEDSKVEFLSQDGNVFSEHIIDGLNGEDAISITDISFSRDSENPLDVNVKVSFTGEKEEMEVTLVGFHGQNAYFPINNSSGDNIVVDGDKFVFKSSLGGDIEVDVPSFQGWQPRWITDAWLDDDRNFRVMWNDIGDTSIGSIDGADAVYPEYIREDADEFFVKYNNSDEEQSIGKIEGFNGTHGNWVEKFSINEKRELVVEYDNEKEEIIGPVDGIDSVYLREFFERDKEFYVRLSNEPSSTVRGKVEDLHGVDDTWLIGLGIEEGINLNGDISVHQHSSLSDFGMRFNYSSKVDGTVHNYESRNYHVAELSDNSNIIVGTSDTNSPVKYPVEIQEQRTRIIAEFNDGEETIVGRVEDIDGINASILTNLQNSDAFSIDGDPAFYIDNRDDSFSISANVYSTGMAGTITHGAVLFANYVDHDDIIGRIDGLESNRFISNIESENNDILITFSNGEQIVAGNSQYMTGIDGSWIMGDFHTTDEKAFNSYGDEIDVRILHVPVGNENDVNDWRVGEIDGRDFEEEIADISIDKDLHIVSTSLQGKITRSDVPVLRRIVDVEIDENDILYVRTNHHDTPLEAGYVAGEDLEDGVYISDISIDYENEKLRVEYSDNPGNYVEIGDFVRTDFEFATIRRDEGALFDGDLHIKLTDGKEFDLGRIVGEEEATDVIEALINIDGELVITRNNNLPLLRTGQIVGIEGVGVDKADIVDGNLVFTLTNGEEINSGFVRRDLGFAPYDFLRTYKRGESATRDGRIYVALNEEVNSVPSMESSEWAIVRFEDDPSPDAGRPDVISPKDMEVFTNTRPFLKGSEIRNYYSVDTRMDRIFSVDTEDGNFTNPVYETTENADGHQVEQYLEVGKVYKWRMRDYVDTGYITDWSLEGFFTVIENTIELPVVSIPAGLDSNNMNIDAGFESSTFNDSASQTHIKSLWQIKRNSDDKIIFSEESETDLTSFVTPFAYLVENEEYSVRVKYFTSENESAFSDWTSFKTRAYFDFNFKPVVEFIGEDINKTVARPAFKSKSELPRFYEEYMQREDVEVFWEVYDSSNELVWEDSNRTFITEVRVGTQLKSEEKHTIRVRYDSNRLRGYSEWSDPLEFTPNWYIAKPSIANDSSDLLSMFYDTTFLLEDRTSPTLKVDLDGYDISNGILLSGTGFGMTMTIGRQTFTLNDDYDNEQDFLNAISSIPMVESANIEAGILEIVSSDRRSSVEMDITSFVYNTGFSKKDFAVDEVSDSSNQPTISIDLQGHDVWTDIDFDNGDVLRFEVDGEEVELSGAFNSLQDIADEIEANDNIESVAISDGNLVITAIDFGEDKTIKVTFSIDSNNIPVDITSNWVFEEVSADVWEGVNDVYTSHDWEIRRKSDDRLVYGKFADFEKELDWEVNFGESDSLQEYYAHVRINGLYGSSEWSDPVEFVMQEIVFTNIYFSTSNGYVVRLNASGSEVWSSRPSTSSVNNVVVNDNREVFAASSDNRVYKLDYQGDVVWTYTGFSGNVNAVSYYDDGRVAAGSSDRHVAVIDSITGDEIWKVSEHSSTVNDVLFDLQGDVVSVSSDNTVIKYNGETGDIRWRYTGHSNNVNGVKIDKSGMIYTFSSDNTLRKINPRGFMEWSVSISNIRDLGISFNDRVYTIDSSGNIRLIDPSDGSVIETETSIHSSAGTAIEIDDNDEVFSSVSSGIVNTDKSFDVRWSYSSSFGNVTDLAINRQPIIVKPIGVTGRFYELVAPENLVAF